jgi:hypothetical protein
VPGQEVQSTEFKHLYCHLMGGLRRSWSRRVQVLVSHKIQMQAGHENVVKVVVKFSEGRTAKEKSVGPAI